MKQHASPKGNQDVWLKATVFTPEEIARFIPGVNPFTVLVGK